MRYFEKQSKKKADNKETSLSMKSFVPAASAGAISGVSIKAINDLEKIENKLTAWDNSVSALAKTAPDRQYTFNEADTVFKKYIEGGTDISQSKVLGVRAGRYLQHGYSLVGGGPLKIQELMSKIDPKVPAPSESVKHDLKKTVEHYKLFSENSGNSSVLKNHMIEKALGAVEMNGTLKNPSIINESTKKIIYGTDKYKTFSEQYDELKKINPNAADVFKDAILGNPNKFSNHTGMSIIGEAKRLTGNTREVVSTPFVYKDRITPHLPHLAETKRLLKRYTLPVVAGLTAIPLIGYGIEKVSAKDNKSSETRKYVKDVASGAGLTVGAFGTGVGINKILNPKKDIAITYGTMPNIGMGHSSPGKVIRQLIEEDPRFKGIRVDMLERDVHSIFRYTPKKYALTVDTGLGAGAHDWADPTIRTHSHKLTNKISTEKTLKYQTDMLSEHNGFGSNIRYKDPSGVIAYGPHQERFKTQMGVKKVFNAGSGPSPAVDLKALQEIKDLPSEGYLDDLIDLEKTVLNTSKNSLEIEQSKKNIKRLDQLKNKKLITITGAGRGDYVASRATELVNALKAHGLHNEYGVLPVMSGAKGGVTDKLLDAADLPSIGKIDRKLFGKIQKGSLINWGSTGTSSLTESMTFNNIQAIPKQWGVTVQQNPYQEMIADGSIAHRQDTLLGVRGPHAALDEWNKGNIEYSLKQKGMLEANNAESIVNVLKDKNKIEQLSNDAKLRSVEHFSNLEQGQKKLKDILHTEWKTGIKNQRLKGLGIAALGLGAIGLAGKHIYDNNKK